MQAMSIFLEECVTSVMMPDKRLDDKFINSDDCLEPISLGKDNCLPNKCNVEIIKNDLEQINNTESNNADVIHITKS